MAKVHQGESQPASKTIAEPRENCLEVVDFDGTLTGTPRLGGGFVRRGDKFVYFSTSDVRFDRFGWADRLLVRIAKHAKDYTGGRNQSTELQNFGTVVDQIFTGESFVVIR